MESVPQDRLNPNRPAAGMARPAILIVDDRQENLLALDRILAQTEAVIIKAQNGNEALKACLNHEFALALLDVNMPGMDGYELAELMRGEKSHSEIPIIFLTAAFRRDEHIFNGYNAGAVDYLVKPFHPEILLNKVKVFMDIYRQKQEISRLNASLAARANELEAANRELESLNHTVSLDLREKEVLLKEVHHRVKNNMQVVYSLLNLQARGISDKEVRAKIEESRDRVKSMSLIHEKLYGSKNLATIDFNVYLKSLVEVIADTYDRREITLSIDTESIVLDVNAGIPCGLIVNELVSNSFKYAFPEEKRGTIKVGILKDSEGNNNLTVADNGIGFPAEKDFLNTPSLGLQLVTMLTTQLHGTIELTREGGTRFSITFPGAPTKEGA